MIFRNENSIAASVRISPTETTKFLSDSASALYENPVLYGKGIIWPPASKIEITHLLLCNYSHWILWNCGRVRWWHACNTNLYLKNPPCSHTEGLLMSWCTSLVTVKYINLVSGQRVKTGNAFYYWLLCFEYRRHY